MGRILKKKNGKNANNRDNSRTEENRVMYHEPKMAEWAHIPGNKNSNEGEDVPREGHEVDVRVSLALVFLVSCGWRELNLIIIVQGSASYKN